MNDELKIKEAVAALDAIDGSDGEVAHSKAEIILYDLAPEEVQRAYDRVEKRSRFWVSA